MLSSRISGSGIREDGWCSQIVQLQLGPSIPGDSLLIRWSATASQQPTGVEIRVDKEEPLQAIILPAGSQNEVPLALPHRATKLTLHFEKVTPLSEVDPYQGSALIHSIGIFSRGDQIPRLSRPDGSSQEASVSEIAPKLSNRIEALEKDLASYKVWQKRSWFKRTFYRWTPPNEKPPRRGLLGRIANSFKKTISHGEKALHFA